MFNPYKTKVMKIETKEQIAEKLAKYVEKMGSQNKAAHSLKNVSSAVLSQIKNRNWDLISEDMWRNIAAQIKFHSSDKEIIETINFREISALLKDAQQHSNVFAVVGPAGCGKTESLKTYAKNNTNAFLLSCNEYCNRKTFLMELLQVMGRDYGGLTVAEMMHEAVKRLLAMEEPVIFMDEVDKLPDQVLLFFITLYNKLEGRVGIVLIATDHLAKRIKRGVKINKKGYNEIYSRIGRKFIELNGVTYSDVVGICTTNGIDEKHLIKAIWDDSENDLRRVYRKIHAIKSKANED